MMCNWWVAVLLADRDIEHLPSAQKYKSRDPKLGSH